MHVKTKVAGLAAALAAALLAVPGCKKAPPAEAPPPAAAQAAPAAPQEAAPPAPPAPAPEADPHTGQPADPHGGGQPDLPPLDAAMKAVYAYQVTLPKAEAYCKAIKELRAAGEKDEKLMARLRGPKPPGNEQAKLGQWLEGIPALKALLTRHGLKGLDLVLMPQGLMQGRFAYTQQRQGSPLPPDRTNASSLELHRAEGKKMDLLVTDCMADLRVISGN